MTDVKRTESLACNLSEVALEARQSFVRASLTPHVQKITRTPAGLWLELDDTEGLRERVEALVAKERECCEFLSFEVSPPGERLRLGITGPEAADEMIDFFAAALGGQ